MTVLVLGSSGQLATHLKVLLPDENAEIDPVPVSGGGRKSISCSAVIATPVAVLRKTRTVCTPGVKVTCTTCGLPSAGMVSG